MVEMSIKYLCFLSFVFIRIDMVQIFYLNKYIINVLKKLKKREKLEKPYKQKFPKLGVNLFMALLFP